MAFDNMNLRLWMNAPPRRKRILSIIIIYILCVIITTAGILTPIDKEQAKEMGNTISQRNNSVKENNVLLQYIFGNNFIITLIMFVPIVGPIYGGFLFYNSGVWISAIITAQNFNPLLGLLALFLTPVAWLEFVTYSIAIAESAWLIRRILQHRGKEELVKTSMFISICALLLLLGAIIESALILAV